MQHFGKVRPGSTLYVYFDTFDGGTGASITMTGLATTDIEIYKDGGTTTRASDTGYALLGTDGIDEFGTGVHGFSVDLSSNAAAAFYEAGSHYVIVVASVTVDAQTVTFIAADFTIGYEGAIIDTTIATLASQTSFTLEEGSADDDAYNGCVVVVHDVASAIQVAQGIVSDYTGSTKTVTLAVDPAVFTMAAADSISFFPRIDVSRVMGTLQTAGDLATMITAVDDLLDAEIPAITAAVITNAAGADIAADIIAMKVDTAAILVDTGTTLQGELDAIEAAVITNAAGVDIAADIIAVKADTAAILVDTGTTLDGRIPAALVGGRMDSSVGAMAAAVVTAAAIATDAIDADALASNAVTEARSIVSGTADSGTTTTMVDAARTEADTDYWKDMAILFTSGTISGQARLITAFDPVTDTITFSPATTQAVGTNTYEIIPNVAAAGASAPTAAEVADAVWDEDATAHQVLGTFGQAIGDPAADTTTIYQAVITDAAGTHVAADIIAIEAQTDDIGAAGAGLTAVPWNAAWDPEVESEATDALNAYDPPTRAEATTDVNSVLAVLGALADAAADGAVTATDTMMSYLKQLINTLEGAPGMPAWPAAAAPANGVSIAEALRYVYDQIGAAGVALTEAGGDGDHLTAINLPNQTMDITGSLSGSVGSVTGAVGSVTGAVGSVTGAVGSLAAQAKADVNAEVLDVLNVDTFAEPGQGSPAATASLVAKLGYLYKAFRNRSTTTATEYALYADDAVTKDQEAPLSDDGTTATRGELITGA